MTTAGRSSEPIPGEADRTGIASLARSWLPTALGSSMLAWEIPLVVAIVGRMPGGASAMAALGAGLSVLFVVNSPALALAPVVVTELSNHGSRVLLRRALATGGLGCALLVALALLPGLSAGFPTLLGLPAELRADFRTCLLSFASAPLAVAVRRFLHGRLIDSDTTRPIAVATVARIGATVIAGLGLWQAGVPAGATGGLALSVGAWAESACLALFARRLEPVPAPDVPGGRILPQHARITSSVLLNMSPALVTTIVIARSEQAGDSLVVWPALYGLVSLGTVPLSDLDSVGAAFLKRAGAPCLLMRFTVLLAGVLLAVSLLVVLTPLAHLYIAGFSNVPSGPANLGLRWMAVLVAAPPLWALRGRLRAVAIAGGTSRALPRAAAVHLAAFLMFGLLLPLSSLPGVADAELALVGALTTETLSLWAMIGRTARAPLPV
ncbi:hypothetical protein [Streptantibioticus ferralitis]|uniref:Polysaccharide biosynthesis protein n=1 Tax=Streptantibioticus ferralitis TaxID=236510 RepID=A0ABT5YVM6_9ACTN|nr:hypothetical protein [Streptantibioticus ferralitis]MDF2255523.1 hypothetical protein [Streptantibioticus ferralitis]